MKKLNEMKVISKTVFAGAVAIVLCSVMFTGVNNKVLASELKTQVSASTTYDIKTAKIEPSEDYVKEDYKVVVNKLSNKKDKSAMTAEAGAELGAKYLWDMYKVSMKGKVVVMSFNVSPITSETRWIGNIYEKYDQTAKETELIQPDYSFMINAITGERQYIQMKYSVSEDAKTFTFNAKKANEKYKEQCEEYKKEAIKFAEKSYGVKIASSDFDGVSASFVESDYKTRKYNPDKVKCSRMYINIIVTDTEGIKYQVTLTEDTKELQNINIIEPDGGSDYLG